MRSWVAIAVLVGGCYSPEVKDCAFTCTGTDCPEGTDCIDGYCRPPDHGSAACSCVWSYTPTNFDPCDSFVVAGDTDWPVLTNLTYNTDQPAPAATPEVVDKDIEGVPVRLMRVKELTVAPNVTLDFVGSRAVILIADRTMIGGVIRGQSGTPASDCAATMGITNQFCGAGGAGGAFAGGGGGGGACNTPGRTPATSATTNVTLAPPRTGCPGARGGGTAAVAGGGAGGPNGGALQISVKIELNISGAAAAIMAAGGGGTGGSTGDPYGGGGGGAGGGILLEGPTLRIGARICAEGGGGGEGTNSSGARGADGTFGCAITLPHKGGSTPATQTNDGGDGGDGGYGNMLTGLNGVDGFTGGGGGGAAGVIRLHSPDVQGPGATFSPDPTIVP